MTAGRRKAVLTVHIASAAKLALLLATILVGALVTGPSIDTMLNDTTPGSSGADSARWTHVASLGVQLTMVLAASALAVFKPAGRTPWSRSGTERARRSAVAICSKAIDRPAAPVT